MSEPSKESNLAENHTGPDYFGFYSREVADLFSQGEELPQLVSASREIKGSDPIDSHSKQVDNSVDGSGLFSNSIGSGLSDLKRERLKTILRQGVVALSHEVDEIVEPVLSLYQIRSHLQRKKHQSSRPDDAGTDPLKKQKCSPSSLTGVPDHASPVNIETCMEKEECPLGSRTSANKSNEEEKSNEEVNADLQLLLEHDTSLVTETMQKYSNELSATLSHMEKHLEEILDTVVSKCRPMTHLEKQHLRKMIQKLPARNLDRVVEIIHHSRPEGTNYGAEIYVDLENLDNLTLWRLYYYIQAFLGAVKRPR